MDYSSGIFAVSRPSKTVIRRKSTCGINTCCVGGCLKQHFLLFNRLGRWTTGRRLFLLYTDYIACFCEVISVRDNVFMMFPWFKWILHLNLSTKSQFSRLKISTFGHENLCVLSTYKAIFFRWKRSFHQDCLQTKLTIMWKMFPYERSFSIWKWSISSTSPPSIFA